MAARTSYVVEFEAGNASTVVWAIDWLDNDNALPTRRLP